MDWRSALMMVMPLALYLGVLAHWHGGRRPVVVSGPADFALLAFGLGGIVLFGPVGQALVRLLSGGPPTLVWLGLASWMSLAALFFSRRAHHRLVVYHVEPSAMDEALREALDEPGHRYNRTPEGFEDRAGAQGVRVEVSPRGETATLEVYGADPEPRLRHLERRLRSRLRETSSPPSRLGWLFLAGSWATLLVPLVAWVLNQPQARAALRGLFHRFPGG